MSGWTRRRFLSALALAASGLAAGAAPRRVAWLVPEGGAPGSAENGLRLALDEAERAATLLRTGAIELARSAGDPARGLAEARRAGAVAVIAAFGADLLPPAGELAVLAVLPARRTGAAGVLAVASNEPARAPTAGAARLVDWHPSLERYGAAQLNERYERRFGAGMDEAAWAAWFALKAVHEASLRAGGDDAASLRATLLALAFDGHKGAPLRFGAGGALVQPRYAVDAGGALLGEVRE
jgi:ABC-type branched-subunit amino acid transport system substrate-binding protein